MAFVTRPTAETSSDLTITLASLASDANLLAGRQSTSFTNSGPDFDFSINGIITTGTSPTVSKRIEIWPIVKQRRGTNQWPDNFGASDANVSVTSRNVLYSICPKGPLWVAIVDATSNRGYYPTNLSVFNYFGFPPGEMCLFVVHDTAVNLNSGSNHLLSQTGIYATST